MKYNLNVETLQDTIALKPKVLILFCHGVEDAKDDKYYFWFESKDTPSKVYKFDEKSLAL